MYINSTRTKLCIVLVLACVLCCITTTLATSKDCQSDQTGSSMSAKRSATTVVVLGEDTELLDSQADTLKFPKANFKFRFNNNLRGIQRLFRRNARSIIDSSKANFNGYIGPNDEKLKNRVFYLATTTEYKKRKNVLGTRRRLPRGNFVRNQAKKVITDKDDFSSYTVTKHQECVACRVNCMKSYSSLGGSLFHNCSKQYYYYGCELVAPCYKEATSSDEVIEGMIGICAFRNGCTFKDKEITKNEKALKRTIKRIRSSQ